MTNTLTLVELEQHYSILAAEYKINLLLGRNQDRLHLEQSVDFLNEMKPVVDRDTPDSRSILEDIIRHVGDGYIRHILELQQHLEGASYHSVDNFYGAFSKYIGKGMLRKPKRVQADMNKLVALYRVTEALRDIQTSDTLYHDRALDNDYDTYWIKDKELLNFILENYEHWETIATFLRKEGSVRIPALEFIVAGETAPLATGAL